MTFEAPRTHVSRVGPFRCERLGPNTKHNRRQMDGIVKTRTAPRIPESGPAASHFPPLSPLHRSIRLGLQRQRHLEARSRDP